MEDNMHKSTVSLPQLRSSAELDLSKPLPTSLQSDFIPEDILFALTQPPPSKDKLGPATRGRNLNTTSGVSRPPPANVWGSKRRDRFKHLIDNTPCACGAGKDISFLYDVPQNMKHAQKPDVIDKSAVRKEETSGKPLQLPDTLIPDEYHIVKNKGVVGIQFHEDKYSTNPQDHEKHLVKFPSMKPASRYEVVQLKQALNNMLDKAGVNDLETDRGTGPTQMHNLLQLIKTEQNIYNVVFHELIRQTSIECVERGELLADLRNKYSDLLNRIPQQIMGLHEEVMAQRALDRRLTDELMRFKGTIGVLTSELSEVKEHDRKVTKEAQKAQEDLRNALSESQKNASLLAEYHDLYELQRRRLERQVFMLSEEREIWSTAAYSLALKVTEEYRLNTAKRLQLSEKGWVKMATHFTVLLSDRDTDLLTKIQGFVENWRDLIEDFNIALKQREEEMRGSLRSVRQGLEGWMRSFQNKYMDAEGVVIKKPDEEFTRSLLAVMKTWDETIIRETEVFGGDNLLNSQEELNQIRREMDGWTDNALKVFSRHRGMDNKTHPDQINMLALNEEVEELIGQFHHRITGENGVAGLVIHLQSALETWDTRLISSAQGTLILQESDWGTFYQSLEEWLGLLDAAIEYVGTTQKDDDRQDGRPHTSIDIHDVVRKTQKWATTASNSVDSEDAKLVEQVSSLHSEMVRWMVQVLLRLAPDKEGNSKEASEMVLLGSVSIPQLTEVAKTLFESLETFSNYVYLCCNGIVLENTQKRQDNMEENADHEMKDLKRLRTECDDWVHTSQLLMSQLTGESIEQLFPARTSTTLSMKRASPAPSMDRVAFVDKEKLETQTSREAPVAEPVKEQEEVEPAVEETENNEMAPPPDTDTTEESTETEQDEEETGVSGEQEKSAPEEESENTQASQQITSSDEVPEVQPKDEGERIEILGFDSNTHRQNINPANAQVMGQIPVQPGVEGSPDTKRAFEALSAVQTLQTQLVGAEERAQLAEIRASTAESEIVELQEKLRALEKMVEKTQKLDRNVSSATVQSTSNATPVAGVGTPTDSPRTLAEGKEDKTGRKSGRSSSKASKKNKQ